jgi:hypothetical protein
MHSRFLSKEHIVQATCASTDAHSKLIANSRHECRDISPDPEPT